MNTLSWKLTHRAAADGDQSARGIRAVIRPARAPLNSASPRCDGWQLLDSLKDEVADLEAGLGPKDRSRLNDYLENVREIEQRIQRAEKQSSIRCEGAGCADRYSRII